MFSTLFPEASDTIAAISTAPGRAAIAVLRVSGSLAHVVAARSLEPWRTDERRCYQSTLRDCVTGAVIDKPIVTVYNAPRSYTGEDTVELSVHGGVMVPALGLSALLHAGAREARGGEFTRRAVLNGKMDLLQAEGVGDLIDARSSAMHRSALAQLEGRLSTRISLIRGQLLDLEALLAYDVDFPEEDEAPPAAERVGEAIYRLERELEHLLKSAGTGELIREGALVVIAGAPNAGKSSLFNTLAGRNRAIVTDLPGTTRDALETVIEIKGWPVRLIDTAGLRAAQDVVEKMGIEVSEQYLSSADIVVACGETQATLKEAMAYIRVLNATVRIIPVWTKADLRPPDQQTTQHIGSLMEQEIPISVKQQRGLERLLDSLAALLPQANLESPLPENALLTRQRHCQNIQRAREEITVFEQLWREGTIPISIATIHLKGAERALEEMIGSVETEDVLDNLFRTFCVGK